MQRALLDLGTEHFKAGMQHFLKLALIYLWKLFCSSERVTAVATIFSRNKKKMLFFYVLYLRFRSFVNDFQKPFF